MVANNDLETSSTEWRKVELSRQFHSPWSSRRTQKRDEIPILKRQRDGSKRPHRSAAVMVVPTLLALSAAGVFLVTHNRARSAHGGGDRIISGRSDMMFVRAGRVLAGHDDPKKEDAIHATSYAQRHPNYYNTNRYSINNNETHQSGYYRYYEDDDQLNDFRRSYHHGQHNNTDLTDVALCLLTALGWAVWMISSAVSSKQAARAAAAGGILTADEGGMDERFWQPRDSTNALLTVHGNVLQVTKVEDKEDGLPQYRAVIDYMIKSELTQESLQIRKQFDTMRELEQGFANVELLVLPEEPMLSILKEDYEEQMLQVKSVDDEIENELLFDGSQCKRLSTALAAVLVLVSLGGTVQVVNLMEPEQQWQGWLILCVGVASLLPCAVVLHKFIKALAAIQEPSEKHGIVIDGVLTKPDSMLSEACMPPCYCCEDDDRRLANVASYIAPETSGCYFVRYNSKRTAADGENSLTSQEFVSSNSSISGLSDDSPMRGQVLWQSGSMDSL